MLGIHPTGRETPPASPRAPTDATNDGKLDSPKSEGEKPVRKHRFSCAHFFSFSRGDRVHFGAISSLD